MTTLDLDQAADQLAGNSADSSPVAPAPARSRTVLDRIQDDTFRAEIAKALPNHVDPGSFVRHAATLVAQNPGLMTIARGGPGTDPQSIVRGVMRAAALGLDLDPTLGQAWLVPRRDHGTHTAVFQVGYQGWLELINRDGRVVVEVKTVHQADGFEVRNGTGRCLKHTFDPWADRGPVLGWFAYATFPDGRDQWETLSVAEAEAHRDKHAPKKNGAVVGPWKENFPEMAKKTAFLRLQKWLPKSTEVAQAIADDADARAVIGETSVVPDDDVIDVDEVADQAPATEEA